jgi:hypothetical protein
VGHVVAFTAAAGNPKPTVQWQLNTDGGNTFSNIRYATRTTLTFTATAAENGYEYRAVFTIHVRQGDDDGRYAHGVVASTAEGS